VLYYGEAGQAEAANIARSAFEAREGYRPWRVDCTGRLDGGWMVTARSEVHYWVIGEPGHRGYTVSRVVRINWRGQVVGYDEVD
jgi:hypothetical protein